MKKLLSALLILSVFASLFCASALADLSPQSVVGTWYMQYRDKQNLAILGVDVVVEINRDRSVTVTVDGEPVSEVQTWALEDDTMLFTLDTRLTNGRFTMEDGALKASSMKINGENWYNVVLVRDFVAPEKAPETVPAEEEDAFFGTYHLAAIFEQGYQLNLENEDPDEMASLFQMLFTIDFAEMTIEFNGEKQTSLTDFADGKLIVYISSNDIAEVSMVSDGSLLFTEDSVSMSYLLVPVGAEASAPETSAEDAPETSD